MATKKATPKVAEVALDKIKPPISFKEFSKEPVKGLMFICIIAVGYLYVDIKMSNSANQKAQNEKIEKMEAKLDLMTESLRKSDSTLSASASKIAVLQELGKIK
jgi:archaellum component FlaF (FlaF/FlaG flagellin family)